jgi:predicted metalloprotease
MARWDDQRRSDNVSRRGGRAVGLGVIFMLLRFVFGRFGIMGIAVLVGGYFLLSWLGFNPLQMVAGTGGSTAQVEEGPYDDRVRAVVGSTEDVWNRIFREEGLGDYPEPNVVLYPDAVQSGCGFAPAAVGPFYCPLDQTIYLDPTFFDELRTKFGVQGDFPGDYVIAHEVGHHVQRVTGILDQAETAKQRVGSADANQIQVRIELQADCFAGLWAQQERASLDPGDIEEALNAAAAIGDDTLQRRSGQGVNPDSFTHGTSAQRQRWFNRGFQAGRLPACDTFAMDYREL